MIGDVTFYPNYFWRQKFNISVYPSVNGITYTSSGGETSGPAYDLIDSRRSNVITLDTNGVSASFYSAYVGNESIDEADFFIVDNHNFDTAYGGLRLAWGTGPTYIDLTGYWGGSLGSEMTAQNYNSSQKEVRQPTDGIFLGLYDTLYSKTEWRIYMREDNFPTAWTDDLTMGEWLVGKRFTMSVAPEMPTEISNYDGVQLSVTAGGQKHGFGTYGERKAWRLAWNYITEDDKDGFLEVWRTTQGSKYPFYIDLGENGNPTLYFVRFVDNSVSLEKLTTGVYKLTFLIESEV